MGQGTYACFAEVVEEQFVREHCSKWLDNLNMAIDKAAIDFDRFAALFDEYLGETKSDSTSR